MSNFNERLLKEIANHRKLLEMGIKSECAYRCLELLRFIRNSELSLSYDEGLEQENEWILRNKNKKEQCSVGRERMNGQDLREEIALISIINHALHIFPKSFINNNNEIILEPRNNVYFRLDDVKTELDFKCKMFAWVSRPIAKSLNKYWSPKVLKNFNTLLGTSFTKADMYTIYDRLGNDVNRQLTVRFINSNYDLKLLDRQ